MKTMPSCSVGYSQGPSKCKKTGLASLSRDESACLRGATHVQRSSDRPQTSCYGEGAVDVSAPAPGPSFSVSLPWGPLNRRGPSLSGGVAGTHARSSRCNLDITAKQAKCQAVQAEKGVRPGATLSRQSRSPRDRPMMSISAVATLVAKGTLYWSHRRVI